MCRVVFLSLCSRILYSQRTIFFFFGEELLKIFRRKDPHLSQKFLESKDSLYERGERKPEREHSRGEKTFSSLFFFAFFFACTREKGVKKMNKKVVKKSRAHLAKNNKNTFSTLERCVERLCLVVVDIDIGRGRTF